VETLVAPIAIHDKIAMDKQLDEIDGQKAKAAYIRTRLVSELEAHRYEDPFLFKRFSERIRETLAEYRKSRDENEYLAAMRKMAEDFREGFVGHNYPTCIDDDSDAKAFYGVISETIKSHSEKKDEAFDEAVGSLSIGINVAVKSLARVDWRTSTAIHKKMNQALEDLIWDFSEDHSIDIPLDQIDILLENIIKTAMSRY
jgi:type I restriction enzyme R subunit